MCESTKRIYSSKTSASRNNSISTTGHKTFRYVPRSINQSQQRNITNRSPNYEVRKRSITKFREIPPDDPIPSYRSKSSQSNTQITARSKNQYKNVNLLNDPDCVEMRKHLIENDDFDNYSNDQLKVLLEHLREFSSYSALCRNYDDASQSESLQKKTKQVLQDRAVMTAIERSIENEIPDEVPIEEKLQQFQDQLDQFDNETQRKLQDLEKKHEEDLESFEKDWSENRPKKYRKPSTKLIEIYELERKLGLSGEFDRARIIKQEADDLQLQEMEMAQRQIVKDYNNAKAKLEMKHQEEKQIFYDTRSNLRDLIIAQQKVKRDGVDHRIHVLKIKKEEQGKTREVVFDPTASTPCSGGGAAIYHRESHRSKGHLLPPLIAPNDERIKEMRDREINEKKEKNRQFKARMREKERDAEDLDMNFSLTSESEPGVVNRSTSRNQSSARISTKRSKYDGSSRTSTTTIGNSTESSSSRPQNEQLQNVLNLANDLLQEQNQQPPK